MDTGPSVVSSVSTYELLVQNVQAKQHNCIVTSGTMSDVFIYLTTLSVSEAVMASSDGCMNNEMEII
jgi:hypothetical protein